MVHDTGSLFRFRMIRIVLPFYTLHGMLDFAYQEIDFQARLLFLVVRFTMKGAELSLELAHHGKCLMAMVTCAALGLFSMVASM